VDPTDDAHIAQGVPQVDSVDVWGVLMIPNATAADSARVEARLLSFIWSDGAFVVLVWLEVDVITIVFSPRLLLLGWKRRMRACV
jgi:hypothetical protein